MKTRALVICCVMLVSILGTRATAADEKAISKEILQRLKASFTFEFPEPVPVANFQSLVTTDTWTEKWPDGRGGEKTIEVTAEIWTAAIQAAIDKHHSVYLPERDKPYYVDAPIVMHSGCQILADAEAEIRLKPGTNTCIVRNASITSGQNGPVGVDEHSDSDIRITGGIWTTLATSDRQNNGNTRGFSDRKASVVGCNGVILICNARRVMISDLTIRQSKAYGVHISNCEDFVVDGILFRENHRDGVHINGPAAYGIINQIRGVTYDDFIALNAWDWLNAAPTFGPIHHIHVYGVNPDPASSDEYGTNPIPDGTAEIRILPGTKKFANGRVLDCPVRDCVFEDLDDIKTVKIYDQPNLEMGRDRDFSDPIGTATNLFFRDLSLSRPCRFQLAANVDGLSIEEVNFLFDLNAAAYRDYRLIEIGPMSATYKGDAKTPAGWVELFSPDKDVTVKNLRLPNVCFMSGNEVKQLSGAEAEKRLIRVSDQKLNPNYPKTTPRGGTGKAKLVK